MARGERRRRRRIQAPDQGPHPCPAPFLDSLHRCVCLWGGGRGRQAWSLEVLGRPWEGCSPAVASWGAGPAPASLMEDSANTLLSCKSRGPCGSCTLCETGRSWSQSADPYSLLELVSPWLSCCSTAASAAGREPVPPSSVLLRGPGSSPSPGLCCHV